MTEIDESVLLGDTDLVNDANIDESALLDDEPTDPLKEETDLYDDAIAPSNSSADIATSEKPIVEASESKPNVVPASTITTNVQTFTKASASSTGDKKYCVYVGNLVWYATDADLMKAVATTGIPYSQFADMKFFENRTNGQSKGYALIVFNSENAVRQLMEALPSKTIHGQSPTVLSYNKANQAKLEEAQAKSQTRPDIKKKQQTDNDGCVNMGTIRIGGMQNHGSGPTSGRNGPPPPPLMMQNPIIRPPQPLMSNPAPVQQQQPLQMRLQINGQPVQQQFNRGPPQSLMGNPQIGGMAPQIHNQPASLMGQPINTHVVNMAMGGPPPPQNIYQSRPPQMGQPNIGMPTVQPLMPMNTAIRPPTNGMPPVHVNPHIFPGMQNANMPMSAGEIEEVVNRNHSVSASAISRAVTDAAIGDLKSASETILTAINLIKNSRAGNDERCIQLIYSLQDTLRGLESKVYSTRKLHRERSRSRDRKRRRRSRTRSRSFSRSPSPKMSRRRY